MIHHTNRFVHSTAVSAVCFLVSGCSPGDIHRDATATPNVEESAPKKTNNGEIPGVDVLPLLDHVKLSETIKQCVQQRRSAISITNNISGMYDLKDALSPLNSPQAIRTVRSLGLYGFPFDDDMLEPIKSLDLIFLAVEGARLSNLHAIKNQHSVVALDLQKNPISREGIIALTHMTSLVYVDLSFDAVTEDDIKIILTDPKIKKVTLWGCPKIGADGQRRLRKIRPDVVFFFGAEPRGKSRAKIILEE